jgi:hypothetical protein
MSTQILGLAWQPGVRPLTGVDRPGVPRLATDQELPLVPFEVDGCVQAQAQG